MAGDTVNEISGGIFFSAVIQGRDIKVQLPPEVTPALAGLPDESQVFAGRDADLKQLMDLLNPAGPETAAVRVSAVAGMGGVGKTELVLHAAHAALRNGWFPGGVLFVDVFGYDPQRTVEPSVALDGMLRAAGIPGEHIPVGVQDRSRLFSSVMAAFAREDRPVLVVVDNVSSSAQVRPLLPAGGRAVVTSRHTLADLDARLLELDSLTPQAGVDLLAGQLRLSRGADDTRVTDSPDDALSIARLCAGLPLALRIVAALLAAHPARPLSSMTADLQDARTRLDEIRFTGADGEVAVRSAFDLSYRQIDSQSARTFRLLNVNPGAEVSTEAVSAMTDVEQRTIRRHLDELARAHLIETGSSYGRWRMHDLIRLYGVQLTQTEDNWSEALARLLFYYLNTAQAATRHLDPTIGPPVEGAYPDRAHALEWLDTEYPNLIGAASIDVQIEVVADLSHSLWRFFELRRYFDDWIRVTTHALNIARSLHDRKREARALYSLGGALRQVRRFDEAIAASQGAAAIYRETGDRQGEGIALNNLAAAQAQAGRPEEVVTTSQDAATIFRETGDRYREGIALNNLGTALMGEERFEEAIPTFHKVAAIFHETGDLRGEGGIRSNLGGSLMLAGRAEEAVTTLQDAAAIFHKTGDLHGEGTALSNLGGALIDTRRYEEAIIASRKAAALFRKTGDRHSEGAALHIRGNALHKAGRFKEAVTCLAGAVIALRETNDRSRESRAVRDLGAALTEAKRFEEAIPVFRYAAQLFHETGDRRREGSALGDLGTVLGVGRLDETITTFQKAAQLFHETGDQKDEAAMLKILQGMETLKHEWDANVALLEAGRFEEVIAPFLDLATSLHQTGDRYGEGVALTSLGTALLAVGQFEQAISALEDAAHIFRDTGDKQREGVALSNLGVALVEVERFEEAITALEGAVAIFRETGDQHNERITLGNLETAKDAQQA